MVRAPETASPSTNTRERTSVRVELATSLAIVIVAERVPVDGSAGVNSREMLRPAIARRLRCPSGIKASERRDEARTYRPGSWFRSRARGNPPFGALDSRKQSEEERRRGKSEGGRKNGELRDCFNQLWRRRMNSGKVRELLASRSLPRPLPSALRLLIDR